MSSSICALFAENLAEQLRQISSFITSSQFFRSQVSFNKIWTCNVSLVSQRPSLQFSGQAIAQLDVNWGVDYEPFKDHPARDCFNLTIQEYFHGRNKSEITIKSCFSWTLTEESPTSGMAMLVVDIPSGYIMLQPGEKPYSVLELDGL